MKVPGGEEAFVPGIKLHGYLLSDTHPVGRSKARLFRRIGFTRRNSEMLEEALLRIAREEDFQELKSTPHGTKYVVDGIVESPKGSLVLLRTVWIVRTAGEPPRLVTAYPL